MSFACQTPGFLRIHRYIVYQLPDYFGQEKNFCKPICQACDNMRGSALFWKGVGSVVYPSWEEASPMTCPDKNANYMQMRAKKTNGKVMIGKAYYKVSSSNHRFAFKEWLI